jgi:chromosome segregation ATPase
MWPKILLELLPHFARLTPVADKYFSSRAANDKAQQAALAALAADVRGELGKVSEEHSGLHRQLQEQGELVTQVSVEVTRARLRIESTEARIAKLEKAAVITQRLLIAALVLLAGVSAITVVLLLKLKGH